MSDRFITTGNGGNPIVLDDVRWLLGQATSGNHGIYQMLNNSLREYGDNFIVQGVVASGTTPNIAITEGWIMLAGELVKVDAQTGIDTSTEDSFSKVITFDSAGLKTFRNAATVNTYQKNRGVVDTLAGTLDYNGARIGDKISSLLSESWTNIDDYQSDYTDGSVSPQVRKVNDNNIQLRGRVNKTAGATILASSHILTLPTGFFPGVTRFFKIFSLETTNNISFAEINPSGELRLRGDLSNILVSANGIILDDITISV